jgi:hypothetical protein
MVIEQQFYAYYDTIEETGEVIYCGKGTETRTTYFVRNKKYNNLKNRFNLVRTVIPMLDKDLAHKYEDWLMEYYHTWVDDPKAGKYACNIDGPGTNGLYCHRSKEICKQIGDKQRGKKRPPDVVEKIAKKNRGKKRSESMKRNNSEKLRGRKMKQESIEKRSKSRWKAVIQYDLFGNCIKIYSSVLEASLVTSVCGTNIIKCCKMNINYFHAGKFIWRYFDENKSLEQLQQEIKNLIQKRSKQIITEQSYIVCQINRKTNEVIKNFQSFIEASNELNILKTQIVRCANGNCSHAGGYLWKKIYL